MKRESLEVDAPDRGRIGADGLPERLGDRLAPEIADVLRSCPSLAWAGSTGELLQLSYGNSPDGSYEVSYEVPGRGRVLEAVVHRVRNGIAVNYPQPYMRRRDPDCMAIADDLPSDKPRFGERYGYEFDLLRRETLAWLKEQPLCVFFFGAGVPELGMKVMAIAPTNAAFFAFSLALLQGVLPREHIDSDFFPRATIFVAPPFRHSHFEGRQVVVHSRNPGAYEMFSYNLYPGPSAKKGVYGMLLDLGEQEQWVTIHSSVVQVITPYDNRVTFAHEGASGGGKSEMLEHMHREHDGRLLLGRNIVSGEERYLVIPRGCELFPVADDMALCHPSLRRTKGKLGVMDAENAWFVRLNHISRYGTDPHLEEYTIHAAEPLVFINIDARPDSTALIWEHTEDAPGRRCPNPRVILPRRVVPHVLDGPVNVDIRSFGVRCPPCTREQPSYGIIGLFHLLPPALAWLWRLVAPRGHDNPSVVDNEGMNSEGVGSYWPFATGERVSQANLLLNQIADTPRVRYILCPNQYLGAWQVGFMPQWVAREYLSRRGEARFTPEQIVPARSPLLGTTMRSIMVEGQTIGNWYFRVESQPEVGEEAYDHGAKILEEFFRRELENYLRPELSALGRKIIECCLSGGTFEDYVSLVPGEMLLTEES